MFPLLSCIILKRFLKVNDCETLSFHICAGQKRQKGFGTAISCNALLKRLLQKMCGNGGHLCPKVTHTFKNCRFHQCVNDMLCQIPVTSCKNAETRRKRNWNNHLMFVKCYDCANMDNRRRRKE